MKFFIFIILAGFAATACGAMPARYDPMTDNEKHLKEASEFIKAFEKEREPERLREASMELEDVDLRRVHDVKVRHKQRSDCLELWLTIIQTIDKNLDSSFDPEVVLPMKVSPPKLRDGTQLPPGAAPNLIDDPKAREEYEKAIKENRAKQENYPLQTQLRELNEVIPGKVDSFIRGAYTSSDNVEIKAAIDRILENESRKERFYRSIESKSQE